MKFDVPKATKAKQLAASSNSSIFLLPGTLPWNATSTVFVTIPVGLPKLWCLLYFTVISGESGSGKTENTNFLLHHLTQTKHGQQLQNHHGSGVEQTLLGAGPVLEVSWHHHVMYACDRTGCGSKCHRQITTTNPLAFWRRTLGDYQTDCLDRLVGLFCNIRTSTQYPSEHSEGIFIQMSRDVDGLDWVEDKVR